jgi:hypothetical protein
VICAEGLRYANPVVAFGVARLLKSAGVDVRHPESCHACRWWHVPLRIPHDPELTTADREAFYAGTWAQEVRPQVRPA